MALITSIVLAIVAVAAAVTCAVLLGGPPAALAVTAVLAGYGAYVASTKIDGDT